MYGHHVIEDLSNLRKNNILQDDGFNQGVDVLIESIKEAQHFHLGVYQEFITSERGKNEKKIKPRAGNQRT